jgi:nucleotide-binding universal stress UspA family protein
MESAVRRVLVATDGSPDAALATRAAADLAARAGAELHVVHGWQPLEAGIAVYPGMPVVNFRAEYARDARALLDAEVARLAAAGVAPRAHLREGRPDDEVLAVGREIGADLIVTGSRGRGAIARLVLGSVADGVVRGAPCPVLVVRGGAASWPPARVVIGDDGSPGALRAAELALALGRLLGAEALLVRAVPLLPRAHATAGDVEALRGAEAQLAERTARLAARTGGRAEARVVAGEAAAALLAAAEAGAEPTLLAVGSRGLGLLDRLRLGSVSTKLLHTARGPVIVAPPPSR